MKNSIIEIKYNLEFFKSRADVMQDRISDSEKRNVEMLQIEEERGLRLKRNEETLQGISDSIRKCNIGL